MSYDKRLEAQIGGELFERSSRQVVLTPAGEVFVAPAREALARARAAEALAN